MATEVKEIDQENAEPGHGLDPKSHPSLITADKIRPQTVVFKVHPITYLSDIVLFTVHMLSRYSLSYFLCPISLPIILRSEFT